MRVRNVRCSPSEALWIFWRPLNGNVRWDTEIWKALKLNDCAPGPTLVYRPVSPHFWRSAPGHHSPSGANLIKGLEP